MYKIAVMGDRDSIYGFASLGLEPFPLTDPAEAGKKVKDLAESGYAVIYITEALAAQIEPEINWPSGHYTDSRHIRQYGKRYSGS